MVVARGWGAVAGSSGRGRCVLFVAAAAGAVGVVLLEVEALAR